LPAPFKIHVKIGEVMKNSNTSVTIACLAGLVSLSLPTFADHLPHSAHLRHVERQDRKFHEMKASSTPRLLRVESNKASEELVRAARKALDTGTRYALLILQGDEILFEEYRNGGDDKLFLLSNSVAKSMVALGVGEAFCAGKIKSLDDQAKKYFVGLEGSAQGNASVRNLLKMASGADPSIFDDNSNGINWRDYGELANSKIDLVDYVKRNSKIKSSFGRPSKDGGSFVYSGRDASALALVVEGATGMKFQDWFEKTVWSKAKTEAAGYWQLTSDNRVVAEAVMLATARDYLRLASYVIENINGAENECLTSYLKEATTAQISTDRDGGRRAYGYQMWIRQTGMPLMSGYGGQFVAFDAKTQRAVVAFSQKQNYDSFMSFLDFWYSGK
jgi:CubicO group peptidase (beta-lactamase class C family)